MNDPRKTDEQLGEEVWRGQPFDQEEWRRQMAVEMKRWVERAKQEGLRPWFD